MTRSVHLMPRPVRPHASILLVLAAVVLIIAGCSPDVPATAAANRAVKLQAVEAGEASVVEFIGTVRQRHHADLAFEAGGRLVELTVDIGDTIKAGQVLGALDRQPARLRVQQAQASVDGANAQAVEREANYQRQQRLFVAGSVAQNVVEAARSSRQQATAEQSRYQAELALARRELDRSQLTAPFDGRVIARHADRFAQVTPGQVVLEVESGGGQQVVAMLPFEQAQRLKPGDTAIAYRSSVPHTVFTLTLEGVSPRADNGLVQACLFRFSEAPGLPSSGETVRVALELPTARRLSVPVQALLMGGTDHEAQVFVYQPATGQVALRAVSVSGISEGRAYIQAGVVAGEQVVVAGVAFLVDGQPVSVFEPSTRLAGEGR